MTVFDNLDKVVDSLKTMTVLEQFNWLSSEKGITKYSCKKCQGIELMGNFPNGSIWNLIKHKCNERLDKK